MKVEYKNSFLIPWNVYYQINFNWNNYEKGLLYF